MLRPRVHDNYRITDILGVWRAKRGKTFTTLYPVVNFWDILQDKFANRPLALVNLQRTSTYKV